jgi:hypothetical protein
MHQKTQRTCSSARFSRLALPTIASMERDAILRAINAEIDILQGVRALLTGHPVPLKQELPQRAPKRRKVSAEGLSRMAAAQRARRAREKAKKSTG